MKNTIRVRKNAGTKAAPIQSKTADRAKFDAIDARDAIDLMQEAKAQSAALHMLLADVLFTNDSSVYGEEIQLGITLLIISTHERMDNAAENIKELLTGKLEVAS